MKLSIIIAERNDPFGCLMTVRSVMEELKKCSFPAEIIIVDNSDIEGKRQTLYDIHDAFLSEIKIIEQNFQCLFSARDLAVENSSGEYLLILDSHCLMMKDSIINMIKFADEKENLGILFGLMCYSSAHELDSFCDRDVEKFTGIRFNRCQNKESFKIPLRSMPLMMKRSVWNEIRGYYPLSTKRLSWGGGDFLISLKPLLFGYDNWILTTSGVVHLGPFRDGGFFVDSFIDKSSSTNPRFLGMLVSAYIIGGEELLNIRFTQLLNRIEFEELNRIKPRVYELAAEARRWIIKYQKRDYISIVLEFKGNQNINFRWAKQDKALFPMQSHTMPKQDVYKPRRKRYGYLNLL